MRSRASWKLLLVLSYLGGGRSRSQVLEQSHVFPHRYVLRDERLYDHEDPGVLLDYYDHESQESLLPETSLDYENQPSHYQFSYGVHDDEHGTAFSRKESSDDGKTTGQYKVHLPDGRIQTVIYTADENGFRAKVEYEGEAVHDSDDYPVHDAVPPVKGVQSEGRVHSSGAFHHDPTPHPVTLNHHRPLHFGVGHAGFSGPLLLQGDNPKGKALLPTTGKSVETVTSFSEDRHPFPPTRNEVDEENFTHGRNHFSHVTHFPFAPVAPPPIQFESKSLAVTSPSHLGTPHPHPIIKSHNLHHTPFKFFSPGSTPGHKGSPRPFFSSLPRPKPIVKTHARSTSGTAVQNPVYRKDFPKSHRFARGTDFEEYSTSSPIF